LLLLFEGEHRVQQVLLEGDTVDELQMPNHAPQAIMLQVSQSLEKLSPRVTAGGYLHM